jgi:hypothetical protein
MGGAPMEPRSTPRCGFPHSGQTRPPVSTRCEQPASLRTAHVCACACCEGAQLGRLCVWLEEDGGVPSRRVASGFASIAPFSRVFG